MKYDILKLGTWNEYILGIEKNKFCIYKFKIFAYD